MLPTKEVLEVMIIQTYNNSKIDWLSYCSWEDLSEQDKQQYREIFFEQYYQYQVGNND